MSLLFDGEASAEGEASTDEDSEGVAEADSVLFEVSVGFGWGGVDPGFPHADKESMAKMPMPTAAERKVLGKD